MALRVQVEETRLRQRKIDCDELVHLLVKVNWELYSLFGHWR